MPSQPLPRRLATDPIYIGFAGRIGSGKTSAARHLASARGFQYTRYGKVLREWLGDDGSDRARLQQLGWDVMVGGRQRQLNGRLIAGLDRSQSAAIDGLRHPTDFECLASAYGPCFWLVYLESGQERRFERLRSRFSDYTAFQEADSRPVEAHIEDLKLLASATIENDGALEDMYQGVDEWIARIDRGDHT
jgi:dephospho-CoA kinase